MTQRLTLRLDASECGTRGEPPERRRRPATEFTWWLARTGQAGDLVSDHVRAANDRCGECGKPWPCNWRQLGEHALDLMRGSTW